MGIVQPVVVPVRAKADCPAACLRRAMETDSRRVVAAVSFAVRFSPETGPSAVVLFGLCRCPIGFATAGFVPAAVDLFDPADSDFAAAAAVAVVVVVVVVVAAVDPSDLSVVAAGPGSAVSAADPAFSVCPFAVALGRGMVAVVVPSCSLIHRSSF